MTAEELKTITEAVAGALSTRTAGPIPPAPMIQPLSALQHPAGIPGQVGIQPIGVSLALELPSPDGQGTVSAYLNLPAEALGNLPAVVGNLLAQGWPLRIYRPKTQWGNGGWNQGNYGRRSWR
ncbi:MAG: hypothetical protein JW741_12010 [Sedimentisphaerales bacterium]|nr:hypothetical protein [Sedimentisphaerales bacterium]